MWYPLRHESSVTVLAVLACLVPPAAAQSTVFGLDHTAVGSSTIQVNPAGHLVVANIGSSGQDGVAVDLPAPPSTGLVHGWDGECAVQPVSGARVVYRGYGSGPGVPTGLATEMTLTESAGQYALEASFVGASSATVRLYLAGKLVHEETGVAGSPVVHAGQASAPSTSAHIVWAAIECSDEMVWASPVQFVTSGGIAVVCDRVGVSPESPSVMFDTLERVEILANADLVLSAESLRMFNDVSLSGVGQVELDASAMGTGLVVGNIGSSGNDGAKVKPPPKPKPIRSRGFGNDPENLCMVIMPPDPLGTSPVGAHLAVEATGRMGGMPGSPLGSVRVTRLPGTLEISEHFGPIGATHVLVQVMNGGAEVAQVTYPCPMGPVITLPDWPTGCDKRIVWFPILLPCFAMEWSQPVSMTLLGPGGGTVVGDEVRLLALGAPAALEALESLSVLASDLGELTVVGADITYTTETTAYCTAKAGLVCGPASIGALGRSSATDTSGFLVTATPVRALKSGLAIYGYNGRAATPFLGGFLCFKAPVKRTTVVTAGGTNGTCEGALSLDFNAFAHGLLGGNPAAQLLVVGTTMDAQFWFRDSLATGSGLSAALEWDVGP